MTANKPLASKLFRSVISVFVLITLTVIGTLAYLAIRDTKQNLLYELTLHEKIHHQNLALALWKRDREELQSRGETILETPEIVGIRITDSRTPENTLVLGDTSSGASYQHGFPLIYRSGGVEVPVGAATLHTNLEVISNRTRHRGFITIAAVLTLLTTLWLTLHAAGRVIVSAPLARLVRLTENLEFTKLDEFRASGEKSGGTELETLETAFADMVTRLREAKGGLERSRDELEERVENRTAALNREIAERRTVEASLRESEGQLNMALDNLPGSLVVTDKDLNIVVCSDHFANLYQVPKELLRVGNDYRGFLRYLAENGYYGEGDTEEQVAQRVASLRRPGEERFEDRRPDGRVFSVSRGRGGDGHTITTVTDISELKQAEANLELSEARFRDFSASASDWYWEMDENLRFSYFSDRFTEVTGVPQEVLLGKTRQENGNPGASEEDWNTHLDNLAARRPFRNFVHPRTRPDGNIVWLSINGIPAFEADGAFIGFRGTGIDITEKMNAENNLREAKESAELTAAQERVHEQLLHLALTDLSMQEYLLKCVDLLLNDVPWLNLLRQGGIFLTADKGAGEELELVAQRNLHPEIQSRCTKVAFGQCLCGRAAVSREIVFADCLDERHETRFDGIKPHGHYNVPLLNEETVLGVVTLYLPHGYKQKPGDLPFLTHVSDVLSIGILHRYGNEELKQAKLAADHANTAKSEFLSSISHEIRTPLTGIMGYIDLLLEGELSADARDKVSRVKGATHSLQTLLNEILDLSKLEAGKMEVEYIDFHLPTLLEDVGFMFLEKRKSGRKTDLALSIDLSDQVPESINSDPTRLRQILINLVGNAVKFTDQGGVDISVDRRHDEEKGEVVYFAVEDTGIGIPSDVVGKLFSDFTQADASISRKYEGSGLGLAICKRLVALLGGEIGVESELGKGSRFWFTLPYTPATSKTGVRLRGPDVTYATRRPLRILAAEDNRMNQHIISAILEAYGHQVEIVEDGALAVEAHGNGDYDLILMDVRMPELSGPEATRMIRRLPGDKGEIPIIALTADAMSENRKKYLEVGMNEMVPKPIDRGQLLLAINQVMNEDIHVAVETTPEEQPEAPEEPAAGTESDPDIEDLLQRMQAVAERGDGA